MDGEDDNKRRLALGLPLAAPERERISFVPHPLTVTAAGDYEYFAAQGRHPFVYALAEFVDNSLRATRGNAPRPRAITIALVVSGSNPATAKGLVSILDNGCGMNKQELNAWAVMNYSMEERGKAPKQAEVVGRLGAAANGAGRFLNGEISFFGVGSKNAAFFMGASVKVTTKRADEPYVHELCLQARELEQRYRDRQDVYSEDMVHRNPGDTSTLASMEQHFAVAHEWVGIEAQAEEGPSFTRVVVGDLKPDVLSQAMHDEEGTRTCQELAHLYHYYLHGEQGNRAGGGSAAREGRLPSGEPFPDITVQYQVDQSVVWSKRLAEVDDDMETKLLRVQRAELPFTLQVPDKGQVAGVLYYFPYENDHETVPTEPSAVFKTREDSPFAVAGRVGGPTQRGPSQMPPRATQAGARPTQAGRAVQHVGGGQPDPGQDEEDEDGLLSWQTYPVFEAFWQGRLIPGASIDTLPFIEAVRQKRTAQAKDMIPDEAFRRLRGALFFGPAFKVTRNKLLFRDNIQQLLMTSAVPAERQMEARFRQWLQRCHTTLDKSVRFEHLADSQVQAGVRTKLGESTTAFERISDGQRQLSKGDVVRINAKPIVVARVLHFTVAQVVKEEGCYANGRVHVELLPSEVHGLACEKTFSLRRLEAGLAEAEVEEYVRAQLMKVATTLRLEPMRFATGQALEVAAGDCIPETTATVLNGAGQRMTKALVGSERFALTQRLWLLPQRADGGGEEMVAAPPPAERQRKGKKSRARQDENANPEGGEGAAKQAGQGLDLTGAELVVEYVNKTPDQESFKFRRLGGEFLSRAARYAVEYVATPAAPGQEPLRVVVELVVQPGAPAGLEISGEGKVASALRPFALGEALPSVKVVFCDSFGNAVPLQPTLTPPSVSIQTAVPTADGSLLPCPELEVRVQPEVAEGCLVLSQLQVVGSADAAHAGAGLQLFSHRDSATNPSARQAQARASQEALPVADVHLVIGLQQSPELEPQAFPVQLRPGAPQCLRLAAGHPWQGAEGSDDVVPHLQHKEELPSINVQAVDAWGCPTGPSEHLPFKLLVECPALSPAAKKFDFSAVGVATVSGLAAAEPTPEGTDAEFRLSLVAAPETAGAQAAFAAVGALEGLTRAIKVAPSVQPVALGIRHNGELLPREELLGQDGTKTAACQLVGQPAGESMTGLELVLLDASGAPAVQPTPGRVAVSWRQGCPRKNWDGQPLKLPNKLAAPELVSETKEEWVRFTPDDGPPLEICLSIRAVCAGDPAGWAVSLVDQATSQSPDELGAVHCGQLFALELEVLDRYNNRCGVSEHGLLPQPVISFEGEGPLQYDELAWEQGWLSQGGDSVYSVKMVVAGHPGRVTISVSSAQADALQLQPDSLMLDLRAGAPAALCIDGLASLDCGTKAVIPQLRIRLADAAGNPTSSSDSFDVSINSSALASDGSGRSAAVSVSGGNKTKMKKGAAVFKDVRVCAEEAGSYALRVQSSSRKVALQDAVLHLVMAPQNTVTDIRVVVSEALVEGCLAGGSAELQVAVATEDASPLPPQVAADSLVLHLTPPGARSKSDTVAYTLAAEDAVLTDEGMLAFQLGELTVAGTYNAVAEYTEKREELLAAMSKKDAVLRSSTVQFSVLSGQPVTVRLHSTAGPLPEKITVTSGAQLRQRQLLRSLAVQLQDGHDNAAGSSGVLLRFRLQAAEEAGAGGAAPALQEVQGLGQWETDAQGNAFVGDLSIEQGSGHAPAGALECELVCEARGLYPSSAFAFEVDDEGWAACWRCPVLFSDDAAKFAALEQLNRQREELVQRRNELSERLGAAQQAAERAGREQQRIAKAVEESRGRAAGSPLPATVKAVQKKLVQLQKQAEAQADAEPVPAIPAKYGKPRQAMTAALDKVLQSGDPGVVGVVAQLATIEHEALSRVAAATYRSMLGVVVVRDAEARQRLVALLQEQRYPVPDMMALTHVLPFRGGGRQADLPGFGQARPLAQELTRAACTGSDPPLPMPLPHMSALARMNERDAAGLAGEGPGAGDWPAGLCGYIVNLVRPQHRGHRASLLYSVLGSTLVFETLADASAYREFVVQKLKCGLADIVTLDGQRLSSRGIISGSASFQVPASLAQADYFFGSIGAGGADNPAAAELSAQQAALEQWVELLREQAAAEAAAADAQATADAAAEECGGELEQVEQGLADVDAHLAAGALGELGAGGGSKPAPASRKKQKRGRRQQQQQQAQEEEQQQAGEEEVEAAAGGQLGSKRRRRN